MKRYEKLLLLAAIIVTFIAIFAPLLFAQGDDVVAVGSASHPKPIVDTSAPVPLWSILTFGSMWIISFLGYRIQWRKHLSDIETQKRNEREDLDKLIRDTCKDYWQDEETVLKLERKIGDIAERVSKNTRAKALSDGSLVGDKDLAILRQEIENVKLVLKNELLKEVIVMMNTKMVGGAK